jgi:hypothetical protein
VNKTIVLSGDILELFHLSIFADIMKIPEQILIPMTYLGPLSLYSKYLESGQILIEQHDSYTKQSYRNRCKIYSANGSLNLIVPVKHERGSKIKVKDIRIDYDTDWRRLHWKGIESAYNSSPFFEYFRDAFEPYYLREYVFLKDLCTGLNEEVLRILNITSKPLFTEEFINPGSNASINDLREKIHPKRETLPIRIFNNARYSQVFMSSHGFIPDLSILDLIFNTGPEAVSILRKLSVVDETK